jgi:hypothetical protein
MEALVPGRVEPMYRASGEQGEIVVYAGDLDVKVGDEARTVKGQLELRLAAGPLVARFAGPASEELHFVAAHEATASVSVPAGAPLVPPPATILPEMRGDAYWIETRIAIGSELAAGEVAHAQRFIFHISGALKGDSFPSVGVVDGQSQRQLVFRLPDWDLIIAPLDDPSGERDFAFVVEATPAAPTTGADIEANVDRLVRRLFILLSFIASREVGVGPVCGLSEAGEVIWAKWGAPRLRPGTPGVRALRRSSRRRFQPLHKASRSCRPTRPRRPLLIAPSNTSLPPTEAKRSTFGFRLPARDLRCSGGPYCSVTVGSSRMRCVAWRRPRARGCFSDGPAFRQRSPTVSMP